MKVSKDFDERTKIVPDPGQSARVFLRKNKIGFEECVCHRIVGCDTWVGQLLYPKGFDNGNENKVKCIGI